LLGLAVAGALVVFTVLALGVRDGGTYSWDRVLVEFFDRHYYDLELVHELSKGIVKASIGLGAVIAAALLGLFVAAGELRRAAFWGLAAGGALVFTTVFKELIERPEIGIHQREYSFPSGNATATTAGLLALLFLLPPSRLRRILAVASAVVLPLYGLALVLLLWHYPSDVVAGWALGISWVLALRLAFGEVSGPLPLGRLGAHPIWRSSGGA
jgi:membrane-associated phospholipid phosphatase